jgi:hypothetical protein
MVISHNEIKETFFSPFAPLPSQTLLKTRCQASTSAADESLLDCLHRRGVTRRDCCSIPRYKVVLEAPQHHDLITKMRHQILNLRRGAGAGAEGE